LNPGAYHHALLLRLLANSFDLGLFL